MNWQGLAQNSQKKIQSLVDAFQKFVDTNHKGNEPQDQRIKTEWFKFKEFIKKAPGDTQAHNKHVNNLRNILLKEEVSRQLGQIGADAFEKQINNQDIQIDKNSLIAISRDLKRNVLRNTQNPLDLLE